MSNPELAKMLRQAKVHVNEKIPVHGVLSSAQVRAKYNTERYSASIHREPYVFCRTLLP